MRQPRTILIVDCDPAVRETLREQLTRDAAFAVVEAASACEAEACLADLAADFAAIIIDAALPDGDGHAVCARLRANGLSMPVILMNGLDQANPDQLPDHANPDHANPDHGSPGHGSPGHANPGHDTITIAKPFRLSELMARLHARLDARGAETEAPPSIRIGPYEFSAEDKALRHRTANQRIRLTEKEAAILAFLHRMGSRAVPRQELLTEVWGYNPAVTTHTLETHIYRLRRKIEADPAKACLLITEAGGYRLAVG